MKNHKKEIHVPEDLDTPRVAARCRIELNHKTVYMAMLLTEFLDQLNVRQTPESFRRNMKDFTGKLLGTPERWGILQRDLNAASGGLLSRLQADMPEIRPEEVLLVSYSAAGFSNFLSASLLGIEDPDQVSRERNRLKRRIGQLKSPFRGEYLEFLSLNSCRIGQEMLYLHNLYLRLYGNREKK